MPARTPAYTGLIHAGAGTALFLVQAAAIIPGLLPCLILLVPLALLLVLPALALALLALPLAGLWWLFSPARGGP